MLQAEKYFHHHTLEEFKFRGKEMHLLGCPTLAGCYNHFGNCKNTIHNKKNQASKKEIRLPPEVSELKSGHSGVHQQ